VVEISEYKIHRYSHLTQLLYNPWNRQISTFCAKKNTTFQHSLLRYDSEC